MKEVLSNKEAAEMMGGITIMTLWRMRNDGRLDGCWFYSGGTSGRVLFVKDKLLDRVAELAKESA